MKFTKEGFENGYSVLMSVYWKEKPEYFRESINSMLSQTLSCSDFVLVCDGPLSPELEDVISWAEGELDDMLQCVRLPENRGLGNALRVGLTYCRCPIVARMDSDDISRPDRCLLQMQKLTAGGYAIVGGSLQEFVEKPGDTDSLRVLPETPEEIRAFVGKRNPFNHPCVMFRKEAVLRAGNYEDFPGFEDYYLWVRMLNMGFEGWNLKEVILDMRTGNGMYGRRGGTAYIRNLIRFQKYLRKTGIIGTGRFLWSCLCRSMLAVLPGNLRKELYGVFLRKKESRI